LTGGNEAVVKYRHNREGSITLINELIANSLAKQIGIAAPSFGICQLGLEAQTNTNVEKQGFCLIDEHCGPSFYVDFARRVKPFSPSACKKYNHAQLEKMILFDHIIYNKDRACRNILVPIDRSGNVFPIDYSHVFKNECIWNRYTFLQGMAGDDYLDKNIIESNEEVYKAIFLSSCPCNDDFDQLSRDIPNQLTAVSIQSIISSLPPEWLEDAGISSQDMLALRDYLLYRVAHVDQLAELILREWRKDI